MTNKPSWWPEVNTRILFRGNSEYREAERYGREVARAVLKQVETRGNYALDEVATIEMRLERWEALKRECGLE